jgi:hypothetical protein
MEIDGSKDVGNIGCDIKFASHSTFRRAMFYQRLTCVLALQIFLQHHRQYARARNMCQLSGVPRKLVCELSSASSSRKEWILRWRLNVAEFDLSAPSQSTDFPSDHMITEQWPAYSQAYVYGSAYKLQAMAQFLQLKRVRSQTTGSNGVNKRIVCGFSIRCFA